MGAKKQAEKPGGNQINEWKTAHQEADPRCAGRFSNAQGRIFIISNFTG